MDEPLKPDPRALAQTYIANSKEAELRARRYQDTFIGYLILANAGGILACLGIADALVGAKGLGIKLSTVVGPMWVFLIGLISSGFVVSLQGGQASHEVETNTEKARQVLNQNGFDLAQEKTVFPPVAVKALPHLNLAINVLGIVAQLSFAAGAVWGLHIITASH